MRKKKLTSAQKAKYAATRKRKRKYKLKFAAEGAQFHTHQVTVFVSTDAPLLRADHAVAYLGFGDETAFLTEVAAGRIAAPVDGERWLRSDLDDNALTLRAARDRRAAEAAAQRVKAEALIVLHGAAAPAAVLVSKLDEGRVVLDAVGERKS